jgi:hypothetical protein
MRGRPSRSSSMSKLPVLRDYSRSLAVVMGTWNYAYLRPVPAAEHSMRRMERLLTGPLCGWPQDRLQVLGNVSSPGDLSTFVVMPLRYPRPGGWRGFLRVSAGRGDMA